MQEKTQLLVVGGGAAGMAAATAAAGAGVRVTVLEAAAAVGGNGLFPRGIFGVDSAVQRRRLIFADRDEMFRRCMADAHWKTDARIVRALIDRSGDTIDWLEDLGVSFADVVHHLPNQTPEVFHVAGRPHTTGQSVIRAFSTHSAQRGVVIHTRTWVQSLIREGGRVVGVAAADREGHIQEFRADKVILSTGGFAGNPDMVRRYFPGVPVERFSSWAGMRHRGDGLRMALEAGADVEGHFAMEVAAPKLNGYAALSLLLGKPENLWLNRFGRRFADEGIVYDFSQAANACMRQPESQVFVLFDAAMMAAALRDGRDPVEALHIPESAEERLQDTLAKAVADGAVAVADDIRTLAPFVGCGAEALAREIALYNQGCAAGHDPAFAKQRRFLKPLATPPFYAARTGVDMLITHGGVRVNERFEALAADWQPVENLYVAGVDFGGADADVYDMKLSGHGFGFAVNSGRMAGEYAAAAILER